MRSPYHQAVELQAILMDAARNEETTQASLAQVARAWSELEERKRIIKMKPKPKDVDVSGTRRRSSLPPISMLAGPLEEDAPKVKVGAKLGEEDREPAKGSRGNGDAKGIFLNGEGVGAG